MVTVIRFFIGSLFIFSGILKFTDLDAFSRAIFKFHILPLSTIIPTTFLIPSLELICGAAILLNIFKKGAIYILGFLMSVFTLALIVTLSKGITFECNCFGPLQLIEEISGWSIIINLWLLGCLAFLGFRSYSTNKFTDDLKYILVGTMMVSVIGNLPLLNNKLIETLYTEKIQTINFDRAFDLAEESQGVLIDGRAFEKYNQKHVPGALSVRLEAGVLKQDSIKDIKKTRPLMIYCDNNVCGLSEKIAIQLIKEGFTNLYIIKEGFSAWENSSN